MLFRSLSPAAARWQIARVAAARGLALSLGVPAIGVTVTEALAVGVPRPCRAVAPLRPAEEAVRIDTTGLGIDAVVWQVLALLPARMD